MPAKRGERKETNTKKTLLISLLIGNALGVAIFFILLSIASAVILKKGVSSGAYTPVSSVSTGLLKEANREVKIWMLPNGSPI